MTRPKGLLRPRWVVSWVAVALLGLVSPPQLAAQERAQAEEYFSKGNALFVQGRYTEATKMFQVCIALQPQLAGPYRRLGQAYQAQGLCAQAIDQYLRYLELRPQGKYANQIRQAMANCAQQVGLGPTEKQKPVTGQLIIEADTAEAEVTLDGQKIGQTPMPSFTTTPGTHRLRVSREGHRTWSGEVEITAGKTHRVAVGLPPLPASELPPRSGRLVISVSPANTRVLVDGKLVGLSPIPDLELRAGEHIVRLERSGYLPESHPAEVPPDGQVSLDIALIQLPQGSQTPASTAPSPAPQETFVLLSPGSAARGAGWILSSAGAASAVAGIITGTLALQKAKAYEQATANSNRAALRDEGQAYALAADISFGAALLMGLTGTFLILGNPLDEASPPKLEDALEAQLQPSPWVRSDGAGLGVTGRF